MTFYNTMLSRMAMIKSGRLDDPTSGENVSDVESTLKGLGIELRNSEGQFRNFEEVLNEVGNSWEKYSSTQQRAIAAAFAGTRQQTRFLSLMSGYAKAAEYAAVAADSAGVSAQKLEIYQESIEAKANKMTAAFENMSQAYIPEQLIGGFYDTMAAIFDLGSAANGLIATLVGIPATLLTIKSVIDMIAKSPLGQNASSLFGNIKSFVTDLNTYGAALTATTAAVSGNGDWIKKLSTSYRALTSSQLANIAVTKQLSLADFEAALNAAGITGAKKEEALAHYETMTAKTAEKTATDALTLSAGNLLAAVKAHTVAALQFLALNPLGWLVSIGAAIAAVTIYTKLYNKHIQDTIDKSKELQQASSDALSEISSNLSSVKALSDEFKTLADGVDDYGNNLSLSSDEYSRYNDLVKELVSINPSLVKAYNAEGEAIIEKNTAISETIALLQRQRQEELLSATTSENNIAVAEGVSNQYKKDLETASKASDDLVAATVKSMTEIAKNANSDELTAYYNSLIDIFQLTNVEKATAATADSIDYLFPFIWAKKDAGNIIRDNLTFFNSVLAEQPSLLADFSNAVVRFGSAEQQAARSAQGFQSQMNLIAQASVGYDKLTDKSREFISTLIGASSLDGAFDPDKSVTEIQNWINTIVYALSGGSAEIQNKVNTLMALDFGSMDEKTYQTWKDYTAGVIDSLKESFELSDDAILELKVKLGLVFADNAGNEVDTREWLSKRLRASGLKEYVDLSGFFNDELEILLSLNVTGIQTVDDARKAIDEYRSTVANSLDTVASAYKKLKSATKDRDVLSGIVDAFKTGDGNATLARSLEDLIKVFPKLRDEVEQYSAGLMDAAEFQDALNKALIAFDTDTIYDGINDIADAVKSYGSNSYQVRQAVQELERVIPGLTDVLYDEKTGMFAVNDASVLSTAALYGFIESTIQAELTAKKVSLDKITEQLDNVRDAAFDAAAAGMAAIEVYGSASRAMGYVKAEMADDGQIPGVSSINDTGNLKERIKSEIEELQALFDSLRGAKNRYYKDNDVTKTAFDKEYAEHKHRVAMELETEKQFYDWLEGANEEYFANSIEHLDEYRKYLEEVFTGRRDLMEDVLSDYEVQISLMSNQGGQAKEIVQTYRTMQDVVHDTAESIRQAMRNAGWSEDEIENSDIIQQLKSNWWDYRDSIKDVLSEVDARLEEHLSYSEHEIFLLENQGGQEDKIIAKYIELQGTVHDAANAIRKDLRELGYSEEEIAQNAAIIELQKKWWEYNQAIKDVIETLNGDMNDALQSVLDLTIQLIKQEQEDMKDALESQIDD